MKIGRGMKQGHCLSLIMFYLYSKCLTKEALEGFGDFRMGRQVIHTMEYAVVLMLLAKQQTVLQGMFDRPIEIGTCCGMEMNVGKTKAMRISRQAFPVQTVVDKKQPENVEYFNCLASMVQMYL
jgi:hypothetical protein